MLLVRLLLLVLIAVAAAIAAILTGSLVAVIVAALLVAGLTLVVFAMVGHWTSSDEFLGGSEQSRLVDAHLVERDTGLPSRNRWSARRDRRYAEEQRPTSVPSAWSGPEGAHRALLLATRHVSPGDVRGALGEVGDETAILVVVPALAGTAGQLRRGAAAGPVAATEHPLEQTVAELQEAGLPASGHVGAADPAVALSDGLRTYDPAPVVVARRHGPSTQHLEDVPLRPAAETFGVPLVELAA